MRCENINQLVSPLVRLNHLGTDVRCRLYAKCEFLNTGGSLGARIGRASVEILEEDGLIKVGDTLVIPSGLDIEVGVSLGTSHRRHRLIVIAPPEMSGDRRLLLETLGADVVVVPDEYPGSHYKVAERLQRELPNSHLISPSAGSTRAARGLVAEILHDLGDRPDMVVAGGVPNDFIVALAQSVKQVNPLCRVVGVLPSGPILGKQTGIDVSSLRSSSPQSGSLPSIESMVDEWVQVTDQQSFLMARQLIRDESLIAGGLSGLCLSGAIQTAPTLLLEGQNGVVIFPDSALGDSKQFLSDQWMRDNGFPEQAPIKGEVRDIPLSLSRLITANESMTIAEVISLMREHQVSELPVTSGTDLVGMVSDSHFAHLSKGTGKELNSLVAKYVSRDVPVVGLSTSAASLPGIFAHHRATVIVGDDGRPLNTITRLDFLRYQSGLNAPSSKQIDDLNFSRENEGVQESWFTWAVKSFFGGAAER